jgi:hypothetical protein
MKKIYKKDSKDPNMGIRTKGFGPPMWLTIFLIIQGYPYDNPSKQKQRQYKKFLTNLGNVIPCSACRESYKVFITKKLPITENALKNRKNLAIWGFKLKNLVNKKIGCKVISKKQMENKYKFYDNFRASKCGKDMAGCTRAKNQNKVPKKTKIIILDDYSALDTKQRKILKAKFSKKKRVLI